MFNSTLVIFFLRNPITKKFLVYKLATFLIEIVKIKLAIFLLKIPAINKALNFLNKFIKDIPSIIKLK